MNGDKMCLYIQICLFNEVEQSFKGEGVISKGKTSKIIVFYAEKIE